MLKKIAAVIAVLLLVVLGLAATKPDTFEVQRSTTINAPPEAIYGLINDYHKWGSWSPWEKLDTAMSRTYSGADSGVGAVYEWSGNSDVGSGRMEIMESSRPEKISMQLDFLSPMEARNTTGFALTPSASGTNVTWSMNGPQTFLTKIICVFVSMDKMIGPDFERGLANLKAEAERSTM